MQNNKILLVDDDTAILKLMAKSLLHAGYSVTTECRGAEALQLLHEQEFDIVITDLKIDAVDGFDILKKTKELAARTEVIVMTGYATVETAVSAMQHGAYDYVTKPLVLDELNMIVAKAVQRQHLMEKVSSLRCQVKKQQELSNIIAVSPVMKKFLYMVERIAASEATILIEGESGSGKEIIARAIHNSGPRSSAPFVAINCGAMPENILESELFGHVRGAFTGANFSKKGLFEEAHSGTIFLDEVGETSPGFQVKLLRVLQENEIRRVGDIKDIAVDARVLAASNIPLRQLVEEGIFRQDLYYRLRVVPLQVPPLRERSEDIIPLAKYFFSQHRRRNSDDKRVKITKGAIRKMEAYSWPGNVRELENVIERALILVEGSELTDEDILLEPCNKKTGEYDLTDMSLKDLERLHITKVLDACFWNQTEAAKRLGIGYNTLWRKIKRYKLSRN